MHPIRPLIKNLHKNNNNYLKNRKEILSRAARLYVTIHAAYKKKHNRSYYKKHRVNFSQAKVLARGIYIKVTLQRKL